MSWLAAVLASLLRWPDGYVRKVGNTLETAAGGGGGATTLDGLTDVTITAPSNGQVLTYDAGASQWINAAPTGGGSGSASGAWVEVSPIVVDALGFPHVSASWDQVDYV